MRSKYYKPLLVVLLIAFFSVLPFVYALLFSSKTDGGIEIDREIKADFVVSDKRFVLLFFGYVGCKDICTPFLYKLNSVYESKEFQKIKSDVNFLFVNLTHEVQEYQPDLFSKFFNENFEGVYLSKEEIFSIDREFGLFFSRTLSDDLEMNHTDYLYLIENKPNAKILKSIYTIHPLNSKKLIDDIILLKSELLKGRLNG